MKYFRLAIAFVLIFYLEILKAGQEDAALWEQFVSSSQNASVVELAINARGPIFDDFSHELSSILTDFTKENSIHEASLSAFEYLMGDTISPTMIDIQGFEDLGNEDCKDIVILFKDSEGNLLLVMKWFRSPNSFINEISAMEKLQDLNLSQSGLALPLTVGKAFYNDQPYYLIVETAAKGETIISLINAIAGLPEGNERKKAVETAMKAVALQGKALAELHMKDNIERGPGVLPLEIEEIASKLNDLNKDLLSIDDLVPQIKSLEDEYLAISHSARYMLGDPNWGNFLYDDSTSKITMIDLNLMNFSIGSDGLPLHDAATDYSIVMTHFWFLEAILKDQERQLILNSFDEAYRRAIEDKGPTDLELAFALVARWALYARGSLFYTNETDKELQEYLYQHVQKLHDVIQIIQTHQCEFQNNLSDLPISSLKS